MIGDQHRLTPGYVARHIPPASRIGLDIAVLDIAQDFLLTHLHDRGILGDLVVFKGGSALRKLFAGAQGRFSTDLDLAVTEPEVERHALAALIAGESNVSLGPFRFESLLTRDRWRIRVTSPFASPEISIKLDVGPPCWLRPEPRPFIAHATQERYGFDLPALSCMRLEEILAEKIARLARSATARDASDLVWVATTSPHSQFLTPIVRRVAILKTWVDNHGLGPAWSPALSARPFDVDKWLSPREEWDDEQIGSLTNPPPSLEQLEADLRRLYAWLRDMTDDERLWAKADARDRSAVIRAVHALPNAALAKVQLW